MDYNRNFSNKPCYRHHPNCSDALREHMAYVYREKIIADHGKIEKQPQVNNCQYIQYGSVLLKKKKKKEKYNKKLPQAEDSELCNIQQFN